MRKLSCVLLIAIVACSALILIKPCDAAYVGGVITYNTTWTYANSPYTLISNVVVSSGITLTIEPGVAINFGVYQMQVNGVLIARGNTDNKILFAGGASTSQKVEFTFSSTSWNDVSNFGCIIDNALISSVGIHISGSSPRISNNYISASSNLAISISGGSPLIQNNIIVFNQAHGIQVISGSATITGNTIGTQTQHGGINGIFVLSPGSATITNNNVLNGWTGIDTTGYCIIEHNNIMNNGNDAIHSTNAQTIIQDNALAHNAVGVSSASGYLGTVQNNTISDNSIAGIWAATSASIIRFNNLIGNAQSMHLTETDQNVTATSNWWGTADQALISANIWDHKNASNLGTVDFVPFLTQENLHAPTVPEYISIPPPPPTPAPQSTAPPPTLNPNATYTPPTQQPWNTPTEIPYQYPTPTFTPYETPIPPTDIPHELTNEGDIDLTSIAVIALAIMTTMIIVFIINRKFARASSPQPKV